MGQIAPLTIEAEALSNLFRLIPGSVVDVAYVNDGVHPNYQQPTAKQRILATLYDVKNLQQKEKEVNREDITKQLAILPVSETSDVSIKEQVTN